LIIPGQEDDRMGKVYRVYRIDGQTAAKVPIGTVQERRNRSREASNLMSLMKLARKMYAETPEEQTRIFLGEEMLL
jgi:hypothetical protein